MDCFNHKFKRGKNIGSKMGFPMAGRCCINSMCKLPPINKYLKSLNDDIFQYIGIAIDEPKRLERLSKDKNKISLLKRYSYTETMACDLCKKYDLLSPMYEFSPRGGCWFCPNARKAELRYLRKNHPNLWRKLLDLEDEKDIVGNIWNTLNKTSIHDIEKQFKFEELQMSLF